MREPRDDESHVVERVPGVSLKRPVTTVFPSPFGSIDRSPFVAVVVNPEVVILIPFDMPMLVEASIVVAPEIASAPEMPVLLSAGPELNVRDVTPSTTSAELMPVVDIWGPPETPRLEESDREASPDMPELEIVGPPLTCNVPVMTVLPELGAILRRSPEPSLILNSDYRGNNEGLL